MVGRGRGWSLWSLVLCTRGAYGLSAPGVQRRRLAHMPRPPATVHRLRPRNRRQVELLQEALDLGGWSEPTRVELNKRLTTRLPDSVEPWSFAMVAASPETVAAVLKAGGGGAGGFATPRGREAPGAHVGRETGAGFCSQTAPARAG